MPTDPNTGQRLPYPGEPGGAPMPQRQMPPQGGPAPMAMPPGAPGGGPMPGATSPGSGTPGMMDAPPPEFAQHIDPNNHIQGLMLSRLETLSDPESDALMAIPPQTAMALKKLMPEIAFVFDTIGGGAQGGAPAPGGMGGPGSPPPMPPQMAPGGAPQPRPRSMLGQL